MYNFFFPITTCIASLVDEEIQSQKEPYCTLCEQLSPHAAALGAGWLLLWFSPV